MKRLDELPIRASGCVAEIIGDDDISLRILEMGLIPGTEVRVLGTAPFGDPIELEVRGYRLSLRRREAARVLIDSNPTAT